MIHLYTFLHSPIDQVFITTNGTYITGVFIGDEDFQEWKEKEKKDFVRNDDHPLLMEACLQLQEYFQKKRTSFQLPLFYSGTKFQQSVWNELLKIPYGETRSYQFIAKKIGNKKAVRAVGQANRANHIPIIIPCHRVIGKNGKLTGYAGSRTEIKDYLLKLES
jgi:methylated-DNA-[protein]-cysteine S-methyltransferase